MSKRFPPLLEGEYYHIYNRGNNREQIFFTESNYKYFLKKLKKLITPYAYIYSYCLLPNHFHLFIKIKPSSEFPLVCSKPTSSECIVSNQFRKFFISFSRLINFQQNRTGSLFQKNFKRKLIINDTYFSYLIFYIHSNAEKHGIIKNFKYYKYSSYTAISKSRRTWIAYPELINWFGSREEFEKFHEINRPLVQLQDLVETIMVS